jgi:hypothetical protein
MSYFQFKWTETDDGNPFGGGSNLITHTETSDSFSSPPESSLLMRDYPPPFTATITITFSSPTAAMTFNWNHLQTSMNYYYSIYVLENFAYNPVPLVSPILLVSGRTSNNSITYEIPHIYMNIHIRCNIYYEILGGATSSTFTINNPIWYSIPDTPVITVNSITYGITNVDTDTLTTTWTSIGGARYKIGLFNTNDTQIGDWSTFYETVSVNPLNLPFSAGDSPKSFYTKIKAYPNTNYFDQEYPETRMSMSAASATATWYTTSLPNPVASLPTITITPQGGAPGYSDPIITFTWNASTGNNDASKATFYTWTFYETVVFDVYAPLGGVPASYTGIKDSTATSGTITETYTLTSSIPLGPVNLYVRVLAGNRAGPGNTLSPNADDYTVAPYIASFTYIPPCPTPTNISISAATPNSITMKYDGKNGLYFYTYNYILYKIVSGVTTQVTAGTNTGQGNFIGVNTDTIDITGLGVAHNNHVYFTQQITNTGYRDSPLITSANFTV